MSAAWLEESLARFRGREGLAAAEWGRESHEAWLKERFPGFGAFELFAPARQDPALPVPLADASVHLVLTLDFLETLRMDQLYMVASEARRVCRPGGLWLLRGLSSGPGPWQRLVGRLHARRTGARPLELTHYVSPEDWSTLSDSRVREGLLSRQLLALERL